MVQAVDSFGAVWVGACTEGSAKAVGQLAIVFFLLTVPSIPIASVEVPAEPDQTAKESARGLRRWILSALWG